MKTILTFLIAFILIPLGVLAVAWCVNHAVAYLTQYSYLRIYYSPYVWLIYFITTLCCIAGFFVENPLKVKWRK